MRKFLIGLVAFLLLTLPMSVVQADPPMQGSGNYTITGVAPDVPNIRQADGNTIIPITFFVKYTGTLEGTSTLEATLIVHPNGLQTFQGFDTFTGKVAGVEGTMVRRAVGKIEPGLNGFIHGQGPVVSGTGGLENLRGSSTFQRSPPNPFGIYELNYHFDGD